MCPLKLGQVVPPGMCSFMCLCTSLGCTHVSPRSLLRGFVALFPGGDFFVPELMLFRVCHPASPLQMVARYPVPFLYFHGISQDLPFLVPSWKLLPLIKVSASSYKCAVKRPQACTWCGRFRLCRWVPWDHWTEDIPYGFVEVP